MENTIICDSCSTELDIDKAILYEWDEENLAWYYCKKCSDRFQGNIRINEKDIEKKRQVIEKEGSSKEFNKVIGYFNSLIESHNLKTRIITDERDHKHFMDELNYYADEEPNYCMNVIPCRLWFGFSGEEILKTVFIDDRTTMKDIDLEVMKLILERMQKSEKIELNLRHEKELEDLKEQENISPGKTPPKFVPNPYPSKR